MQKSRRNTRFLTTLLLLSLGTLACCLTPRIPETVTPFPPLPPSQTPTPQQPTPTPLPVIETPEPNPTSPPKPTQPPAPTEEPTPSALVLTGPEIAHNGVSFTIDPTLGDEVLVSTASDTSGRTEFLFEEGYCYQVGCMTVYPVKYYREEIMFGADIIDGLQSAIEMQSNNYFPVLVAHILLRAQTRHFCFQNGAGIRAVVMIGQDTVFANNESVVYEFHGLTDDGQYYVAATFPIDAPMLLSTCCDPADNTNEAAIPVPELPEDDVQAGAVLREYNQEAERQLDALDGSSFTPDLALLDALVASLLITPPTEQPLSDGAGALQVDVDYRGNWYRETFSYTRQAENIAHFVLVMPSSQVDRATADQVFGSIDFSTIPGALSVREGREEFAWALNHVYDAPGGYFRGQFEPGTYYVAAAFVAAPISREGDAILYAGMTGGGASTDYWMTEIEPGENTITLSLTDSDGWACPWLYVYDGHSFERRTEILRNVRGKQNEQTETSPIGPVEIVDGTITLMVVEEKDEITFIDELYVIVDGIEVRADADCHYTAQVAKRDHNYLTLTSGESVEFRFTLPDSFAGKQQSIVSIVVSGFYEPQK
ncbi:MAG: hypothetical protein GY832_19685 [Chloroflexi bacterium]|nr:hypothetical protein [Chloroflexota bacterium]